uniref:Uncharacterized protein n=1 Tax=Cacopsylla melanoneura TaxID=428564 RepID=A0A8D8S2U0_9HEMI
MIILKMYSVHDLMNKYWWVGRSCSEFSDTICPNHAQEMSSSFALTLINNPVPTQITHPTDFLPPTFFRKEHASTLNNIGSVLPTIELDYQDEKIHFLLS